jgi:hypothetical protein
MNGLKACMDGTGNNWILLSIVVLVAGSIWLHGTIRDFKLRKIFNFRKELKKNKEVNRPLKLSPREATLIRLYSEEEARIYPR